MKPSLVIHVDTVEEVDYLKSLFNKFGIISYPLDYFVDKVRASNNNGHRILVRPPRIEGNGSINNYNNSSEYRILDLIDDNAAVLEALSDTKEIALSNGKVAIIDKKSITVNIGGVTVYPSELKEILAALTN